MHNFLIWPLKDLPVLNICNMYVLGAGGAGYKIKHSANG